MKSDYNKNYACLIRIVILVVSLFNTSFPLAGVGGAPSK